MEHVDRRLIGADLTAGCLFVVGLGAALAGMSLPALGLWAACVWIDWRVLRYLRGVSASADRDRLAAYVDARVTRAGIAQVLAATVGLAVAVGGHLGLALGIWLVVSGGVVANRGLARLGERAAPEPRSTVDSPT
jgi:hypothetical protein